MNRSSFALLAAGVSLAGAGSLRAQISFDPATQLAVGQQPAGVALLDADDDGDVDLAVTTDAPDRVELLLNAGGAAFGPPTAIFLPGGSGPGALVARDFTGDGATDLAVVLQNSNAVGP